MSYSWYKVIQDVQADRIFDNQSGLTISKYETPTEPFPFEIEIIAEGLYVPWAIDISSEGTLYVTERSGSIRIVEQGQLLATPLITFEKPFQERGEGGLLGLALDPDFTNNHYIYVMYNYVEGNQIFSRVVRLVEENNTARVDKVLLDKITGGPSHLGGRVKVGPDNKLYITTGDAGKPDLAQDIKSTAGKILRIQLDGSIPEDNPIPDSPVYSFGHRNPQGLAWNEQNVLFASEHGATAHDEINIIQAGVNYGWPLVQGEEDTSETTVEKPFWESQRTTWAPAGIAFLATGPWKGKLLVSTLRGLELLALTLNNDGTAVEKVESWLKDKYGRLREVIQAQDGSIYITTSNRDGRANPLAGDDKIIRLK